MIVIMLWIFVQIILESLPVSSSGHVALLMKFFDGMVLPITVDHMWIFDYLLHGPTIIILLLFFFKDWWQLLFRQPLDWSILCTWPSWLAIGRAMMFVGIADSITVALWWLDAFQSIPLIIGFSVTAGLLYSSYYFERFSKQFDWNVSYAVVLGVVQGIALLPGISRFAITYMAGKYFGYENKTSLSISFMVQFPLIVAGFCKGLYGLRKQGAAFTNLFDFTILFAILSASVVSFATLLLVEQIIQRKKLWYLSWYMMVPIMLTILL